MNRLKLLWLFLPLPLLATELAPWFGPFLEPQLRGAYILEYYPSVDTTPAKSCHCLNRSNDLHSGWLSFDITPWPYVNVELEGAVTHSVRSDKTFFEYGQLTARYKALDDLFYDPVSLTLGLSLAVPSHSALNEVGLPWLGHFQAEFHAAVGREITCRCESWDWRFWLFGGAAWSRWEWPRLRAMAFVERNYYDCHRVKLGLRALAGLGDDDLQGPCCFHGWAPIATRAAEVEAGYEWVLGCWGSLWIDYRYRFYARNYPRQTHIARLGFFYPISL